MKKVIRDPRDPFNLIGVDEWIERVGNPPEVEDLTPGEDDDRLEEWKGEEDED